MAKFTHAEMTRAAVRWLRDVKHHSVVLTERTGMTREQPDAIGFSTHIGPSSKELPSAPTYGIYSVLVECKASAPGFYSDRQKHHRARWGYGMGQERWYMVPKAILKNAPLPDRWGLVWFDGEGFETVREATPARELDLDVCRNDMTLLMRELQWYQREGLIGATAMMLGMTSEDRLTLANRALTSLGLPAIKTQDLIEMATRVASTGTDGAALGEERRPGGAGSPRRIHAVTEAGRKAAWEQRATAAAFWGAVERAGSVGSGEAPAGGEDAAGEPEADDASAPPERIVVLDEEA